MGYFYGGYDDFYEPSEFDEKVEEFKDYLRNSVKDEIKEEISKLKEENAKLQAVRNNWDKLKSDYENKLQEIKKETAKMRLSELFGACGMNMELYKPG